MRILSKKFLLSFSCVMASATLFSGTASARGFDTEFHPGSGNFDSSPAQSESNPQSRRHVGSRKIDSVTAVAATDSKRSTSRYDHTHLGLDVHGGLSVANLSGPAVSSSGYSIDNNYGFTMGGGYDCELSSNFAVRPELNFVQKGFSVPVDNVRASLNMYYLEMPLLLKGSTDMGSIRPNLVAGPAVGVNVGNSVTARSSDGNASVKVDSVDTGLKKLDYGFQMGGGVEIPTDSQNAITADIRYDLGLANINGDSGGEIKNRAFLFTMGFKF
jgi:hypothetical protein